MNSPFKFLEPYTLEDAPIFFGREQEINDLYELLHKSRMIVLFGRSGMGKSSLVRAGLARKLDIADWYPLLVKRNTDINQALKDALASTIKGELRKGGLIDNIRYIYKQHLRPIYLIFDQLEDLFINGQLEERKQFITNIKLILDAELNCKIIFVIDEIHLARLFEFEQIIPNLLHHKLRVSGLSKEEITLQIKEASSYFNLKIIDWERFLKSVSQKLPIGHQDISPIEFSAFLSIFFNRLLEKKEIKTNYSIRNKGKQNYPEVVVNTSDIDSYYSQDSYVEYYVSHSINKLMEDLAMKYPSASGEEVNEILKLFIGKDGSSQVLPFERKGDQIILSTDQRILSQALASEIVERLIDLELLKENGNFLTFTHNYIGTILFGNHQNEEWYLKRIKQDIALSYTELQEKGRFLNESQLTVLDNVLPQIDLEPHLHHFIRDSRIDVQRKQREQEELQINQEREQIKKSFQRRQWGYIMIAVASLLVAATFIFKDKGPTTQKIVATKKEAPEDIYFKQQRDSLKLVLDNFLQEQADEVSKEVDDLISRAYQMEEKGYLGARRELLQEAKQKLSAFRNNPKLADKITQVNRLLN